MKRTLLLIALLAMASTAWGQQVKDASKSHERFNATTAEFSQQPKEVVKTIEKPTAPAVSDKVGLGVRTEQLAQSRMSQEYQALQKQLEDSPLGKRLKELDSQFQESAKKMRDLGGKACGDPKVWVLDYEAMKCVEPKPETAQVPVKPKTQ